MSYPNDKETFRRVINQDLPEVPGDTLDETDQNKVADFLERLQNTLGYGIGMGYSTMKEFFDSIIAKFATIKKVDIITLHQSTLGVLKNPGDWVEYGSELNPLATDIILFQVNFIWRRYLNETATISITLQRLQQVFAPVYSFSGGKSQEKVSSNFNFVLINPTAGDVPYYTRIYAGEDQSHWEYISFTAIKISL